jgi:hypothetical protein
LEATMYIGVENYKELYLNNKDEAQIQNEIEKIKREIEKLKFKMESPSYAYEKRTYPSERDTIVILRKYLDAAHSTLAKLHPDKIYASIEEMKSDTFDLTVNDISTVTLTVGAHFQYKYDIHLSESLVKIREVHIGKDILMSENNPEYVRSKILDLKLGEWKREYLPEQYGCTLSEPVKWQLRIEYSGGSAPRFFDGLGIFPYNFDDLLDLFGIDCFW